MEKVHKSNMPHYKTLGDNPLHLKFSVYDIEFSHRAHFLKLKSSHLKRVSSMLDKETNCMIRFLYYTTSFFSPKQFSSTDAQSLGSLMYFRLQPS